MFPVSGRKYMSVEEYKKWTEVKIEAINQEMATLTSKKDPRWLKLRKSKNA